MNDRVELRKTFFLLMNLQFNLLEKEKDKSKESEKMFFLQLLVVNPWNKTLVFDIESLDMKGNELKQMIGEKIKIPCERLSLMTGTKMIKENQTLKEQKLENGSLIYVNVRLQ